MALPRSSGLRALRLQSSLLRKQQPVTNPSRLPLFTPYRQFHQSRTLDAVKPFLLADIGEGITECQLIQWFVQPGARVEQFDKICEVQSDKASVEITSPFDGVIKKLHYEPDDMAITGKPLVDIDIDLEEISEADAQKLGDVGGEGEKAEGKEAAKEQDVADDAKETEASASQSGEASVPPPSGSSPDAQASQPSRPSSKGDKGALATPAVRRITREHNVKIEDIQGSGKDGRVLKEDVQRHVSGQSQQQSQPQQPSTSAPAPPPAATREDKKVSLTPVQSQMFKAMTKSLNIPHFLYTTTGDMTAISAMRGKLNAKGPEQKVTHLAFVLKALSLALRHHPLLNAQLIVKDGQKPELTHKGSHNFGIAIDSPSGLLVPVLKNVQDLSITEIAANLRSLGEKARSNKLAPGDFSGATFTVSNIGSVGGGVVAPVISEPQVAIMAIGRSKFVPAFDENDELIKKEELTFNWSADHRVVDGAECARCAERVRGYLEDPAGLIVAMR
ncbi:2-oxoacid dehydrogenases acyltransferase-domain-containing protein [Neohortaea acidophila]|uniref:Dihydrolipoamide acetyltransferase component of pyruvate dehydrogenase complex n=1 Tax=Neohortaea acidophila TaxID=245834 RepID=A0A6A6PW63_9PEZI|nr:2-oxoacid dehydrogenases acyltransferase-domain-containing protein [Neohortaea acidophila]KAF2484282.1 2-oxoacid dehydrogenases acyltransferase-domain-containing protein [Neohortaea acidophila]